MRALILRQELGFRQDSLLVSYPIIFGALIIATTSADDDAASAPGEDQHQPYNDDFSAA